MTPPTEGPWTPLIQQYLDVKSRHADSLLFFRVGDFYEMFFDDAEEGSGLLGLTLTSRNNGGEREVPLAGVPVRAASEYVQKLLAAGRRVAICEQVEDAAEADGLVRREVVEVITPGTVLEDSLLAADRNNYVVAIGGEGPGDAAAPAASPDTGVGRQPAGGGTGPALGLAAVDLSTGEFELRACPAGELADELARLEPAELLVPQDRGALPPGAWTVTRREPWRFDPALAAERLRERFGVRDLRGYGLRADAEDAPLIAAAGALVAYLEEVRPAGLSHLRPPRVERGGRTLHLDAMTRRNLELVEPLRPGEGRSLLSVLDRTRTAMGGRLLRRRLLRPLTARREIEARLDAVDELVEDGARRGRLREALGRVRDLERLAAKASAGRIAPRELLALGDSLAVLPGLVEALGEPSSERLGELARTLDPLEDITAEIREAIAPDAPPSLSDGGVIRAGYSEALDEARGLKEGAVDAIAAMQARERERTGIDSLKIGFNKVFGYYLEVTKTNLERVPSDYVRKQTLANAERYFTPELKEWEEKVSEAEAEIAELEARLFSQVRERIGGEVGRIQEAASRVAEVDVLAALAEGAERHGYVRPEIADDRGLEIRAGRHPVVERTLAREAFIPNDLALDEERRVVILTGPNMAGKSTILRQVGLIALMAQVGSFVPADRARIGLCDRIFTRVGASDNLAAGMSTFMVEMTETATILNGATERSLVLLDEIGRGTSTYDGLSIAWAVTERLHGLGARTLFATHYHELVELADVLSGVVACNVAVRERGEEIVFLHRLEPGGSDRSYGVHVARLAGLPPDVVGRAESILRELENGPVGAGGRVARVADAAREQLPLFGEAIPPAVLERLEALDPDRTTPLEALMALAELKRLAQGDAPS